MEYELPPLPPLQCAALKHLAGPFPQNEVFTRTEVESYARAYALEAIRAERERCAKVCDKIGESEYRTDPDDCAAAIRSAKP